MPIIYTKNNINLNFINNYVKFFLKDNCLYLNNTIYNKEIILNSSNASLKELLIVLHNGVNTEELIKVLSKISSKPKELYEYLLQNFIIE